MKKKPNNSYFYANLMRKALRMAQQSGDKHQEVPVAAMVLHHNTILASATNQCVRMKQPLAHAEILAMKKAQKKQQSQFLHDCILLVTLEPCLLCVGALIRLRIPYVIFSATDKKQGALIHFLPNLAPAQRPIVTYGLMAEYSTQMIENFFKKTRENKK
jgi:tRNA(adenine34) deaminase